jgi:molecular chaperone DnaK
MIPSIDFGNYATKVAIQNTTGQPQLLTNRNGETSTRTYVYFNDDGSVLIGTEAENAALANPGQGISGFKRRLGTDDILYSNNGRNDTAVDITAIFLSEIKKDIEAKTGMPCNQAVLTLPANSNVLQRQHTIDAASRAGIEVIVTPNEPTAAALGNEINKMKNCTAALYDLGGGTFDISLLTVKGNVIEVKATNGKNIGGMDINQRFYEKILDAFEARHNYRPTKEEYPVFHQDLLQKIEHAKISLSAQMQYNLTNSCNGDILTMNLTRQQFEEWIEDPIRETIDITEKTIRDAGLTWDNIDVIYAVGGSSRLPIVKRLLEQASGKKISQSCEAHCAAALGGVIAGRLEYERQGKIYTVGSVTLPPPSFFVRDILSNPVGILVLTEDNQEVCSEILAQETPIPSIQTKMFKLTEPNQTEVRIEILQGPDGTPAPNCLTLGHFELNGLPVRPDIINRIEVTFDIDPNGILTATARDTVSNKKAELQIDYKQQEPAQAS